MTFHVLRRGAPPNDSWHIVHRGSDEAAAWREFERACAKHQKGAIRITQDGWTLKTVTLRAGRAARRDPALRKILRWIGPSATLVQLECGHRVNTHSAHATRCQECRALISKGRPRPQP